MKDFFKYLTIGSENKNWGLYLNVIGKSTTIPGADYPSREHPSGYYFNFNNGRILNEYQFIYIIEGSGIFETRDEALQVTSGTLLIIRKNQWHRYRPDSETGWTELYIGFDGSIADHFLLENKVLDGLSFLQIGKKEYLIDIYYRIFNIVTEEKPGFQEISSGLILNLLGYLVAYYKQKDFSHKPLENSIQNLRFDIRTNILHMPDLCSYALNANVSVDYFRNMFKKYTGVSPYHYHLYIKLLQAKELLVTTNKSVKEVAYQLDFNSIHYFSRCFKKKFGINPSELRK